MILAYLLLSIPLLTGLASLVLPTRASIERVNAAGALASLVLGSLLALQVFGGGPLRSPGAFFYLDALSAFEIGLAVWVTGAVQFYACGHLGNELEQGRLPLIRYRRFHALVNGFVLLFLLLSMANHLGVVWIALEGTTLATAFLVAFSNRKAAIEAAWQYFMLGTVGLTLGLMGLILLYYSALQAQPGLEGGGLDWSELAVLAKRLDPDILKLSFVFTLIGYGTKVGLAPLHAWKPDAYAEAPAPVGALLSGLLANGAMYGILRSHAIVVRALGEGFSNHLLLLFGLLSLAVAVPFVLRPPDVKRLLAYSSIEHMGIIALGLGFGGRWGVFGALLHTLFHSLLKPALFFTTGNAIQKYGTRNLEGTHGVLTAMPVTGSLSMLGAFALAGAPPFGLFLSEFTILSAGFQSGLWPAALALLVALVLAFMGFAAHFSRMGLGAPPAALATGELGPWTLVPAFVLLGLAAVLGVYLPAPLPAAFEQIVSIVRGLP